jgi:hypothetical protein
MGLGISAVTASIGGSSALTANQAYIYPFRIHVPELATKLLVANGSTVSGNIDIGIYDSELNKVISAGATVQAGTNSVQELTITATWLIPGDYFMAFSINNTTGTIFRSSQADELAFALPMYTMASAHPLPTTITLTKASEASPFIIVMGILLNGTLV